MYLQMNLEEEGIEMDRVFQNNSVIDDRMNNDPEKESLRHRDLQQIHGRSQPQQQQHQQQQQQQQNQHEQRQLQMLSYHNDAIVEDSKPRKIPLSDSLLLSLETVSSSDRDSDLKYADRWLAAQDAAVEATAAAAAAGADIDIDAAGIGRGGVFTPSEYAQTSMASTSTSSYATSGITSPNEITSPPSPRNAYDVGNDAQSRLFSPQSVRIG